MSNTLWDKFDKEIDTEALAADVAEAAANGSDTYKEVPHGEYEVAVTKMELGKSKKGDPMVTIWFKIINGEYKGSLIFFNQVVLQDFQIAIVNKLLLSMDSGVDINPFKHYNQYGNMLMDVLEAIDEKLEFALNYGKGKKDFSTYEITEVFEVE